MSNFKFEKLRVLVVDDFLITRRIVVDHLKKLGVINIEQAENGVGAIEKIRNQSPQFNLIITDSIMPEMDGIELIKWIRGSDKNELARMPILLMILRGMQDDLALAINAGINGYVIKPLDPEVLRKRIIKIFAYINK